MTLSMIQPLLVSVIAADSNNHTVSPDKILSEDLALAEKFNSERGVNISIALESGMVVHNIKFPTILEISQCKDSLYGDMAYSVEKQGADNIQVLRDYINSLDLSAAEKQKHINYIEEAATDGYVESYVLYDTTGTRAAYTHYGTYSGTDFYQMTSGIVSVNHKKETKRTLNTLNKWLSTSIDIVLTIEKFTPVSMGVTLLNIGSRLIRDNYTAKSGDYAEYYVREVRRNREIGIINQWNDFQTVLVDAKANLYPYMVYHFADPAIYGTASTSYDYPSDNLELYSQYYNNKSFTLSSAYNQYTQRPDIILYLNGITITSSMFRWEWK